MSDPVRAWAVMVGSELSSIQTREEAATYCSEALNGRGSPMARVVELVEVVRCADCRHWEIAPSGVGLCVCPTAPYKSGLAGNGDWFCADGRRREP